MKKIIYDYMTEDKIKKMMEIGRSKTQPIMNRSSQTDLYGNPYKMYKITTIIEEVPKNEIKYHFDKSDLKKKYTQSQQDAGARLYQKNPLTVTEDKDHGYNNYTRVMGWHELGAKRQEEYIRSSGALYNKEDDDWF